MRETIILSALRDQVVEKPMPTRTADQAVARMAAIRKPLARG